MSDPRLAGLSAEAQRELLEKILREKAARRATFPLSRGQHALWVLHRMAPESAAYNIAAAARVRSPLDVAAFRAALVEVARRHELLRATFDVEDGQPVHRIHPEPVGPFLDVVDASSWEPSALQQRLVDETRRPFDLAAGPLFKAHAFRRSEHETVLLITVHHIVFDGWSFGVLWGELLARYDAGRRGVPCELPALTSRYADFVQWQETLLASPEGEALWAFWRDQLAPPLPVIELPTDRPRPKRLSFTGHTCSVEIDRGIGARLRELSRSQGVTLYMVLLAAFQCLLLRYSGQREILVGSPTAGRSPDRFGDLIGYFVNPVVLRGDLSGDPTFAEVLGRTRRTVLDALKHADFPFPLLVQRLNPTREPDRSPLFQVEFNFVKAGGFPADRAALEALAPAPGRLQLEPLSVEQQEGQFDLALEVTDLGDSLRADLKYATDLFEGSTIERMAGHLQTTLRGIVSKPEARISELPLLSERELDEQRRWNATKAELPEACVHEQIALWATQCPERVAVACAEGSLTFGELERRAERIAALLRERGLGPGALVAVYMERGLSMLAALLGVWKAGAAYVPLDPGFPAERLSYMVEDSGAALLLTQSALLASVPSAAVPAIAVDEPGPAAVATSGTRPVRTPQPDDLAYVIYTSGSTGRPKGVAIPHRALLNLLLSMQREPGLCEDDVLLSVTTLSFDIAALELFLPLLVGGRVYLASREDALDGRRLIALLEQTKATVMQATPASWRMLLESGWAGTPGLKLLCGGEALPRDLAEALLERAGELWNVYGPTETTVWSSVERVSRAQGPISIGRPIANTQMWVLDERLQPLPVGVAGELYIGGTGLARSYWKRPELTAEKFVADPFSQGQPWRLYRTGDLARWLPDGRLECLGRIDHQVKIRGFRIELGEIEAALREHPNVDAAVVLAQDMPGGDRRLVAYLTAANGEPEVGALRQHLAARLPAYMLPSAFAFLAALPLTPNGKVDRKALPTAGAGAAVQHTRSVAPRTATERTVARIWEEILSLSEPLGVEDNFFDLGGHSFSAARMMAALHSTFEIDLGLRSLFERPTIAGLSEAVDLLLLSSRRAPEPEQTAGNEEFEF